MSFHSASATIVTATVSNVVAEPGQWIFVEVREFTASPATPDGTGLPGFSEVTLTSGAADNGAGVRGQWYKTLCGISFNDTLAFGNSAYGYAVYVESGLDAVTPVLQAVGAFGTNPGTQTITYPSTVTSGNRLIAGWIGFTGSQTEEPSTPRSGWTDDFSQWDAGTIFVVAHSRSTTDTAASVSFADATDAVHGVALELRVTAGGGISAGVLAGLIEMGEF
jgi:hypothetical protein